MNGIKKHIAFILLGIFVFPIFYQPYHIVLHHSEELHCHHDCCSSKIEKSTDLIVDIYTEKEEPCPICNYHFPVNDIPGISFFATSLIALKGQIYDLDIKRASQQVVSIKTPRAPPEIC